MEGGGFCGMCDISKIYIVSDRLSGPPLLFKRKCRCILHLLHLLITPTRRVSVEVLSLLGQSSQEAVYFRHILVNILAPG